MCSYGYFTGSHTGQAISYLLHKILKEWDIPTERVHAVVSDNGANVKAGLRLARLPSVSCSIHTIIQLVVEKGLKSQRVVIYLVSRRGRIAGHFSQSNTANEKLQVSLFAIITYLDIFYIYNDP